MKLVALCLAIVLIASMASALEGFGYDESTLPKLNGEQARGCFVCNASAGGASNTTIIGNSIWVNTSTNQIQVNTSYTGDVNITGRNLILPGNGYTVTRTIAEGDYGIDIDGEVADGIRIAGATDLSGVFNGYGIDVRTILFPAVNNRSFWGYLANIQAAGSNNVSELIGYVANPRTTSLIPYTGVIANLTGLQSLITFATGSADVARGVHVSEPIKTGGTWRQHIGLDIDDITGGTVLNASLRTKKGLVTFNGKTNITDDGNITASNYFGDGRGLSNVCLTNTTGCNLSSTSLTNVSYLNNTQVWFVGANQTFQGRTMVRDGSGGNGNAALTVIQQTQWSGALPYSLNLTTNTSNGLGFFYAHGFRIGGAEGPAGGNLRHLQRVTNGNLDFSTVAGSITFSPNDDKLVLKVDPTFWASINGSLNVSVNARTNRNMTVNNSLDIGAGLSSRRANVGGVVHSNVSNSNNTGTTETNLYGYNVRANTFFFDGDTIRCRIVIKSAGSATATSKYSVLFAGNKVYDSGDLGFSVATDTVLDIEVIRDNSTRVEIVTTAFTTTASAIPYAVYTPLEGVSFNADNPVNVTGTRGGVGAATGDISAKNWRCEFLPAGAST